jgi:hypothetical protein
MRLFVTRILPLAILASLSACTNKAIIKPKANFLENGTYRSHIETAPGAMTGLSLQLNGNGRFSLATLEGGCFVAEEWGAWSSTQEELSLRVQKSMRRASCASAWQTVQRDTAFICPMRSITDRSFQMLHDEIKQGTVWTEWQRISSQGYAELERLRMEPEADEVTLNSEMDARKSSSEKVRANSTRSR